MYPPLENVSASDKYAETNNTLINGLHIHNNFSGDAIKNGLPKALSKALSSFGSLAAFH